MCLNTGQAMPAEALPQIVAEEVPPTFHPLGPNNKLVIAPGLLSGTVAANSGRISMGAKSPLTGTIKGIGITYATSTMGDRSYYGVRYRQQSSQRWWFC